MEEPRTASNGSAPTPTDDGEGFRFTIPTASYETREELLTAAQSLARRHGFALSVGRSHRRYVYLNCSRGGQYQNRLHLTDETRRRRTRTHRWVLTTLIDQHNHPPEHAEANPRHRRMTSEQLAEVERLTRQGARPSTIMAAIRQMDPTFAGNSRTIYNARASLRRSENAGRPPGEYMLAELASQAATARSDESRQAAAAVTALSIAPSVEVPPQGFLGGLQASLAAAIPAALPPLQPAPALPRHS